jgi:hypothetical protein
LGGAIEKLSRPAFFLGGNVEGASVPRPLMFPKRLAVGCVFLILVGVYRASCAPPLGLLEGHLKILSLKEVELAEGDAPKFGAQNYAEYP